MRICYQGWGRCFQPLLNTKMNKEKMFLKHWLTVPLTRKELAYSLKKRGAAMSTSVRLIWTLLLTGIHVSATKKISFQVYDQDTGTVYPDPSGTATRNFVGQVRRSIRRKVLQRFAKLFLVVYPQAQTSHGLYLSVLSGERLSIW